LTLPFVHGSAPPIGPAPVAAHDEFWLAPGTPREHQQLLHEHFAERAPAELEHIRRAVRRRITEQEVTFNILGVPEGSNRPWRLDSVPLVMAPGDWATLSRGLEQRARLLELVVRDCSCSTTESRSSR
jgi:uncharacterized circularly permuted ATP-grasp superfamily protein